MASRIMHALAMVLVLAALCVPTPAAAARRHLLEEESPACGADPIVGKPNPEKVFSFGMNYFAGATGYYEVGNQRDKAPPRPQPRASRWADTDAGLHATLYNAAMGLWDYDRARPLHKY
jgi:hypothetical protein